jgi:hypothetical protein
MTTTRPQLANVLTKHRPLLLIALLGAGLQAACSGDEASDDTSTDDSTVTATTDTGTMPSVTGDTSGGQTTAGMTDDSTVDTSGTGTSGTADDGSATDTSGTAGSSGGSGGTGGAGGGSGAGGAGGSPGSGGAGGDTSAGGAGGGAGGDSEEVTEVVEAGVPQEAGAIPYEPPPMLSETGLFTGRDEEGNLILAEGVREFEPRYWLWSDGSDKYRYVYLPPGTQIDTSDPDHWVLPAGTKLWKSFVIGGQLVETRLTERTGDGPSDYVFATYYWASADAEDAIKMDYEELLINAAGTTHDIPNGIMCERCHGALQERALGFSAIQLNHDLPGVTLTKLMDEGLLTDPISLDIGVPGDDELTRDALGYLHANCGNCHNDDIGVPEENVPEPQLLLRILTTDQTLEDTGVFQTAINQPTTASSELAVDYRIEGGNIEESAVHFRMTQRMIEDQMPPIGTEVQDMDGLELIQSWIETLPPPAE